MSRFASSQGNQSTAINTIADELHNQVGAIVAKTGATTAWTAAEMLAGVIKQSGTNGALGVTTATAAALVAALANAQVGSKFIVFFTNTNDNTVTLTGGSGVTLSGVTAVPTNKGQIYVGVVTNATLGAEAVTLHGVLYAPV